MSADWEQVESSFISQVRFEGGLLEVEMLTGQVYPYYNVPDDLYFAFLEARSKGEFYNANIKGRFD